MFDHVIELDQDRPIRAGLYFRMDEYGHAVLEKVIDEGGGSLVMECGDNGVRKPPATGD